MQAGGLGVGLAAGTVLALTVTASPAVLGLALATALTTVAAHAGGKWLMTRFATRERKACAAPSSPGPTAPLAATEFQNGSAHAVRDLRILENGVLATRGLLKRASFLADEAEASIERSRRPLVKLVEAVGEARQQVAASGEVAGTLDELALTTRMVATKASREAFRAGAAGRDLVELAEELQRLAAQSGAAARRAVVHVDEAVCRTDAIPDLDECARAGISDVERQLAGLRTLLTAARQDLHDQASAARVISERVAGNELCDTMPVVRLPSRSVADNDNGRCSSIPAPRPSRVPAMNAQALATMRASAPGTKS